MMPPEAPCPHSASPYSGSLCRGRRLEAGLLGRHGQQSGLGSLCAPVGGLSLGSLQGLLRSLPLGPLSGPLLGLLLAGALVLGQVSLSWAASASTAPHTGLEGGHGRSFGPDVEKRSGNNVPQTSMPMDAYGNPITGERQEAPPKVRPRAGAYGGYGKQSQGASRPLPSPPAQPKWGFD